MTGDCYLTDSMRSIICIKFPPHVIAVAAIYHAAHDLGVSMPRNPLPWWHLFDTNLKQIEEVGWP